MVTIVRRKRGIVGWFFLIIFLAFNAFMIAWFASAVMISHDAVSSTSDAAGQAGAAIGGFVAGAALLWIWLFGAIITGLLALLTRSGKTVVTDIDSPRRSRAGDLQH